jgi:translation initiation factor IF-1
MGDQRYQQLMSALGSAFAQADEGQERRQQAQERERQHQLWLAQRDAVIVEIRATMRQFALSIDDIA